MGEAPSVPGFVKRDCGLLISIGSEAGGRNPRGALTKSPRKQGVAPNARGGRGWLLSSRLGAGAREDESALGTFVLTGTVEEPATRLAILPSLSPELEDVIVRSVVHRDLELSGLFDVIADRKAPTAPYRFDDPVDIAAWKKIGAEVVVKVGARKQSRSEVGVVGLACFLDVGKEPVYEKKLNVDPREIRVTAHRLTDALLGAITGRPGGFASHFTFASRWGHGSRIFVIDADGDGLSAITNQTDTAIAPAWTIGASAASAARPDSQCSLEFRSGFTCKTALSRSGSTRPSRSARRAASTYTRARPASSSSPTTRCLFVHDGNLPQPMGDQAFRRGPQMVVEAGRTPGAA